MKNWIKERFKQYLGWSTSKKWYPVILTLSSLYVFHYRYEIYDLSQINARNLIFLLWLLILLLPLFSEFEFMGIKVKREIEKVSAEVKESTTDLKLQMMKLQVSSSAKAEVTVTDERGSLDKESLEKSRISIINNKNINNNTVNWNISENAIYLFQVRLKLETTLKNLCVHYWPINGKIASPTQMINYLNQNQIIDSETADSLYKIIKIANRGVHDEIISPDYISYVKDVFPSVLNNLEQISHHK